MATSRTVTKPARRRERLAEAVAARDEGMAAARHVADPRVILMIDEAIAKANASGDAWSANDIRDQFAVTSQGLVGDRVNAAANRRPVEMRKIGTTRSLLKSTHNKPIAVWVGVTSDEAGD